MVLETRTFSQSLEKELTCLRGLQVERVSWRLGALAAAAVV